MTSPAELPPAAPQRGILDPIDPSRLKGRVLRFACLTCRAYGVVLATHGADRGHAGVRQLGGDVGACPGRMVTWPAGDPTPPEVFAGVQARARERASTASRPPVEPINPEEKAAPWPQRSSGAGHRARRPFKEASNQLSLFGASGGAAAGASP